MKINGNDGKIDTPSGLSKSRSSVKSEKGVEASASARESAIARFTEKAGELSAPGAPMDMEKIERITEAIRQGTFKVDAQKVAASLVASTKEFLAQS